MLFSTLKDLGPSVLWGTRHQPAAYGFAPFIEFLTIRLIEEGGRLGVSVERWAATPDGEAFRCLGASHEQLVERTPEDHIVAALRLWLAQNPPPDTTTGGLSLVTR